MFDLRLSPWATVGRAISKTINEGYTLDSILEEGNLNWNVYQEPLQTSSGISLTGYKANIREDSKEILGIVSDSYSLIQNREAFEFVDTLIESGLEFERVGNIHGGRRLWLLAKLPQEYSICGDDVESFIIFVNSHDGTCGVRACVTPLRIVCQNALTLAFKRAERVWSTVHKGNILTRLEIARSILTNSEEYMSEFRIEMEKLEKVHLTDNRINEFIEILIPETSETETHKNNIAKLRTELRTRFYDAPDLQHLNKSAYRLYNAVSDFATHTTPLRKTNAYEDNLFMKVADGLNILDKTYDLVSHL